MKAIKRRLKSTAILCLFILFSGDVHAEGKWRERFSRLLPFAKTKTHQLEKQRERPLLKRVTSLGNLELVVLDMESRDNTHNINTLGEMAQLSRKEIHQRLVKNQQEDILEILGPLLKAGPGSILNNEKTAPYFFEIFHGSVKSNLPKGYGSALQEFLSANAGKVMALGPTLEQFKDMIEVSQSIEFAINFLQKALDEGISADEFFATFDATISAFSEIRFFVEKGLLKKFFTDNARAINELNFSLKQVNSIDQYFYDKETSLILLKGGLKQAQGDADKFSAFFNAVARPARPSNNYQSALNQFFVDNAEEIGELNFSQKQVERIDRYVNRAETSTVLLQGGLKYARGDADKLVALFDTVTRSYNSSNDYRNALNKLFVDNAKEIMDSGLPAEQIKRLNDYIDSIPTSIKILELALKKAEYAGDFFNIFHLIAPNPLRSELQHIYGNFLMAHAETIVDLAPSMTQMEKINRYLPSPSTLFDMAKNRRRKKRKRKNKAVCATSAAALLSLGALSEKTGWSEI